MPSAPISRQMMPTTRPSTTATIAGPPLAVEMWISGEPPTSGPLDRAGLNRPRMNFATARAPSNALARAGTFPPPSPTAMASEVSSLTNGSVFPLVAAARNSSTTRRAAASSISVRALPAATCFFARWKICWLAASLRSKISAISRCG